MKKGLTIIIIHWNTPQVLEKLLTLIAKNNDFQINVVDNASKEKLTGLKKEFPTVQWIENKFNRGYAFACNQGATNAAGEWLLFLNPDVQITPEQIQELFNYSLKNDLDVCSIKTTESYQKPIPNLLSLLAEFTPVAKFIPLSLFKNKTIFGGGFLIKKKVFYSVGGFDERFFLWFEDSDLSKRLRDSNVKIGWLDIDIKHTGGESFKLLDNQLKKDIFFQAMDIFSRKHFSIFAKLITGLIKYRYSNHKLLPELQKIISLTIPNLKPELLTVFFQKNKRYIEIKDTDPLLIEWIVVTSGIKLNDIWKWRKKYPDVRFIPIEKNFGFAATVNTGFRASSGNWIGTINDDVFLNSDWLRNLLADAKEKVGSLNPVIKNTAGGIESIGVKILKIGKAQKLTEYNSKSNKIIVADSANAAAVIYSKQALNKVGIYDEKFGSYLEDVDLSLRLKRAGYKNLVSLRSEVIHAGQSTSKDMNWKKQYLDFKNWILVILKNWSWQDLIINFPSIFLERLKNISGLLKAIFN